MPVALFVIVGALFALPSASDALVRYTWLFGIMSWFVIMACALYLSFVPCPKCGKRFHVAPDSTHWNHFTSQCMSCGISIWARSLK
ncbi:hypothetical protein X551_02761 [Methylibium sp. T29]|nr:hypothetical protein X551_02761 [Methylibium sp. T29]